MADNTFYMKVQNTPQKITWKYIFSKFRKKHTRQDFDRAMQIGTPAMRSCMDSLDNWEKPWIFYRMLKIGLLMYLLIYGLICLVILTNGACSIVAINLFAIIVPPLILPVVLMTFFWELNIPQNISFGRILIYFVVGGFLSIVTTILLGNVIPVLSASFAPLTEEPAKLIISILLLCLLRKERPDWKIYGLTGLVIGAAVGAGFGGFESVQYGIMTTDGTHTELFQYIDMSGFVFLILNHVTRGIWAVAGHTLYCAPYAAAAALHTKNGKITAKTFLNADFGIAFGISFLCHFVWNTFGNLFVYIVITIILWMSTLRITKKCFRQAVDLCSGYVPAAPAGNGYIAAAPAAPAGNGYIAAAATPAAPAGNGYAAAPATPAAPVVPAAPAGGGHRVIPDIPVEYGYGAAQAKPAGNGRNGVTVVVNRPDARKAAPAGSSHAAMTAAPVAPTSVLMENPAPQTYWIVGETGFLAGRKVQLTGSMTFGRAADAEIRFPADWRGISGRHCRLEVRNHGVYLVDLRSSFGTYINGNQKIPANQYIEVQPGTEICIGSMKEKIRIQA